MSIEVLLATGKLLTLLLLVALPTALAWRALGPGRAFATLGIAATLSGAAGIATPFVDSRLVMATLAMALLCLCATVLLAPTRWAHILKHLFQGTLLSGLLVLLFSTVLPFGNLEWIIRALTGAGLLPYHQAITTQHMTGGDDWRNYHVTADATRQQDPVLFWRPIPGAGPINTQGFKSSTEMAVPKPGNVFRIMTYGDSNTEGPRTGDWPQEMQRILDSRDSATLRYEVINAGVAGYSSYQGLQRFLLEKDRYQPDLVLVSYGWNDLPDALGQPDKAYRPKAAGLAEVLRFLVRYRSYLALQHMLLERRPATEPQRVGPRVPLDDYLDNMDGFASAAAEDGIEVVFLTRPYRATTDKLLQSPNWRARVPLYNERLLLFASARDARHIDVQAYFEDGRADMFGDECHFTEEGRREMASFIIEELEQRQLLRAVPP